MESQWSLTARREGTTVWLSLAGEFDRAAAGDVEAAFEDALRVPTDEVVLDLCAVSFLDPAAIRTLLFAHARSRDEGVDLTVVRPSGAASRIFTLTRVGEVLTVTDRNASGAEPDRPSRGGALSSGAPNHPERALTDPPVEPPATPR